MTQIKGDYLNLVQNEDKEIWKPPALTRDCIKNKLNLKVWEHRPFIPDLVPCDFHVFGQIKDDFSKQRYENDEEVKNAMRNGLAEAGQHFFRLVIKNLYYMVMV